MVSTAQWFVYILQCADGTYYTGCAVDVTKRVTAHNAGKGAKYTRSHLPVKLVYFESALNRSCAQQREAAIKKLPRTAKQKLILAFSNPKKPPKKIAPQN